MEPGKAETAVTVVVFEDILCAQYDSASSSLVLGLHRRYGELPVSVDFPSEAKCREFIETLKSLEKTEVLVIRAEEMQVDRLCA